MTMPGRAPSTPASHEPAVVTTPSSNSCGVLAQVPDVAVAVLREPVVGVLDHLAVDGHRVPHHRRRRYPMTISALAGHDDLDALGLAVGLPS